MGDDSTPNEPVGRGSGAVDGQAGGEFAPTKAKPAVAGLDRLGRAGKSYTARRPRR